MANQTEAQKEIIDRLFPICMTLRGYANEMCLKQHSREGLTSEYAMNRMDRLERLLDEAQFLRRLYITLEHDKEFNE